MSERRRPTLALRAGRLTDLSPERIDALAADLATLAGPAGFAVVSGEDLPWLTLAIGDDGEPADFTLTAPEPSPGEDWVRVAAGLATLVREGLTARATPAPLRFTTAHGDTSGGRAGQPTVVDVLEASLARLRQGNDEDLGGALEAVVGAVELTGRLLARARGYNRLALQDRLVPEAAELAHRALALPPTPSRRSLEAASGWLVDGVGPGEAAALVAGLPGGGRWFAVAGVTDLAAVRTFDEVVRTCTLDRAPTHWWVSPSPTVGRFLRQACARAHAGSLWS